MSQGSPQGDENGYNSVLLRQGDKRPDGLFEATGPEQELLLRDL